MKPLLHYAAASAAMVVPCFWQSRIQAGDLASHVYNAWLADLIRQRKLPGLWLATQWTNVLFDWMLDLLGERLAVVACVLVFVWGAFALAGTKPWRLLPVIAMLGYGWVFHMGLFNFYLSLGICLWALAAFLYGYGRWTAPLLAAAWLAHALPAVWAAGCIGYILVSRCAGARIAMAAALVGVAAVAAGAARLPHRWYWGQAMSAFGVDQVFVFGPRYAAIASGLLLLAALCAVRSRPPGMWVQLGAITAAAIVSVPSEILLPGYGHALAFIAERMSLAVAVLMVAALAALAARPAQTAFGTTLAAMFFGLLFVDTRALNLIEDRIRAAVAQLPPGARVAAPLPDGGLRVNAIAHMIDRACIGRCFSYGNYEPSTGQFRVRAATGNGYVAASYADSWALQTGGYQTKPSDPPIYQITWKDLQ